MTGKGSDPDQTSEDSRLVSLEERLDRADYRLGNRVLAELLGGLIGGALFGWLIDRIAGTSPWGLLGMLFMGIVVAFRNIIRIASGPRK